VRDLSQRFFEIFSTRHALRRQHRSPPNQETGVLDRCSQTSACTVARRIDHRSVRFSLPLVISRQNRPSPSPRLDRLAPAGSQLTRRRARVRALPSFPRKTQSRDHLAPAWSQLTRQRARKRWIREAPAPRRDQGTPGPSNYDARPFGSGQEPTNASAGVGSCREPTNASAGEGVRSVPRQPRLFQQPERPKSAWRIHGAPSRGPRFHLSTAFHTQNRIPLG
jgi:hypothetical protein